MIDHIVIDGGFSRWIWDAFSSVKLWIPKIITAEELMLSPNDGYRALTGVISHPSFVRVLMNFSINFLGEASCTWIMRAWRPLLLRHLAMIVDDTSKTWHDFNTLFSLGCGSCILSEIILPLNKQIVLNH